MTDKINIFIADSNFLTREGLKVLASREKDLNVIGEAKNGKELNTMIVACQPDVLIIDFTGEFFDIADIGYIINFCPKTNILAITSELPRNEILNSINAGVKSYVLKHCSCQEIKDAIYATAKGEKFFCGKVLDKLISNPVDEEIKPAVSCDAVNISEREAEIIKLIAEGFANKKIADKLFISAHTVNTHRKNIMRKLGVNNTAGIVIYAVKEHFISPNKYLFSSISN